MRLSLALFVLLALSLQLTVRCANVTYYLCGILQASKYQSIDVATLIVNGTANTVNDYYGKANTAYQALALTSGSRTYTDLTVASPSAYTVPMADLAPPGSTGGNDNYIFPSVLPQQLNGNGLTFDFVSGTPVFGLGNGTQMNFWWASGSNGLLEEIRGSTHPPTPLQSTLILSQTPVTCTVPTYAQFHMCLQVSGSGYTSLYSAYVNTTGTAVPVAGSSANGLSASAQGWSVTSVSGGTRMYTNTASGLTTTSAITGFAPVGTVAGNDNYVFPDSNPVFDLSGVAFTLATASPLGDGTTSNVVTIKGSSTTTYYEQTAQGAAQNSVVSLLTFGPYVQNTPPPNCTAVSGAAAVASSYSFCYKVYDTNFTSFITGLLTINPLSAGQAGSPLQTYWTVLSLTGTRTFTDLTTGVTTVSTITNLLPIGSIGGNDNRLYLNSAILLDGDGISVQLDNIPPIYGQYGAANQTKTMNLWYTNGNFEEETVSGTREGPRDTLQSSFTVTPAAVGSPYPVCTNALNVTYYLCAVLQASSYVSVDQATLVVNSTSLTHNDYNGVSSTAYRVVGITSGSRSYTDLTAVSPVQQVVQMKNLSPTGSTGGNDNLFYPGTLPQQLDGDGLTFDFVDKVNVFGRTNGTQMNLWWASGSNSLLEEVSGGTHPPTPLQSTLVISQTPVTCSVPTYAQFHMCLYIIGNGYTSLISAYVNTTGVAARIAPTAANGLTSAAQGWTVVSVSQATRVFTNTITGASSTSTLTGVAAVNSVSGNDNIIFPDTAGVPIFDLSGVAFTVQGGTMLGDGSLSSVLSIRSTSAGVYYEQGTGAAQTTTVSYLSAQVYIPGFAPPVCSATSSATAAPSTTYAYCWKVYDTNFTSFISGILTINPLSAGVAGTANIPYWTVLSMTGTRVYTDIAHGGVQTVSQLTALLPTGSIGGNDNRLYLTQAILLDGDGLSANFSNIPPIYGQNGANQTTTMNLWYDSGTNYDEENRGSTHEAPSDKLQSSFTVYPTTAGTAPPVCNNLPQVTNTLSGSLCVLSYSLPGNVDYPWSVATTVNFVYNSATVIGQGGVGVQLLNGTGVRTYTNRFGEVTATGLTVTSGILYLNASVPVDSNGITFTTSSPVQLPGVGPLQPISTISLVQSLGGVVEAGESRVDPLAQAYLSSVPSFNNVTIGASNLNALAPNYAQCTAPITFTNGLRPVIEANAQNNAPSANFSYTVSDGLTYSVTANLTLYFTSNFVTTFDPLGNPYQTIGNITGTRRYTYLNSGVAGASVTSRILGLSTALTSLTSQRFYPFSLLVSAPGVYTQSTAPFLDGDGLEFAVSPSVPILGNPPGVGTQYTAVNLFVSSPVGGGSNALLTESPSLSTPNPAYQSQVYTLLRSS